MNFLAGPNPHAITRAILKENEPENTHLTVAALSYMQIGDLFRYMNRLFCTQSGSSSITAVQEMIDGPAMTTIKVHYETNKIINRL